MIQNVRKPVLDFSHSITARTQHFTAREWVFKAVDDWLIDAHGPRFFLLEGEPGSGKTAIAARLSQISQGAIAQQSLTALTTSVISASMPGRFISAPYTCPHTRQREVLPRMRKKSIRIAARHVMTRGPIGLRHETRFDRCSRNGFSPLWKAAP